MRTAALPESVEPVIRLFLIVTFVMLISSTPLPLFCITLLLIVTFDCLPCVCASRPMADSILSGPLLLMNVLPSIRTLVRFPPETPPSL